MAEVKITQIRSKIGGKHMHRETLRTLGLKRIGQTVTRTDDARTRGMIRAVAHLVRVEEVK
ncbi:MAG: 50S ribosomal protein L30 [Micrococcales bacterium]|nr:MAG: 50S ribosomal protein L30 [Micrococcales bacterium]PIE26425.1 MAG: 50S ribosomal protein L30 [Micrococcales bacterium]